MPDFADLSWHDAVLLKLEIDRADPGVDELNLLIEWPEGRCSWIRFLDCYHVEARLNFGIVARESVLSADELSHDPGLVRLREKWDRVGADLSKLRCFAIETSSTASKLMIYALDWAEVAPAPV